MTALLHDTAEAARLLLAGELVAFPTETVYGLGADARNARAVAGIFAAKGRPHFNPLIAHYASAEAAFADVVADARAQALAARFWPGPLTLVLPRRATCTVDLRAGAGLDTLAVRVPAHPLALNAARQLDPRRQKALSRYYLAAGAGGLAVGVHTTQFAIREIGLFEPVLRLAAEAAAEQPRMPLLVAGAIGRTEQAVREAMQARALGDHAVLLSLAAWKGASEDEMIAHCEAVAREMLDHLQQAQMEETVEHRVLMVPLGQMVE
jgi:hypothetical protein